MMTRMMITSIRVNPRCAAGVFMGFSGSGCFEVQHDYNNRDLCPIDLYNGTHLKSKNFICPNTKHAHCLLINNGRFLT